MIKKLIDKIKTKVLKSREEVREAMRAGAVIAATLELKEQQLALAVAEVKKKFGPDIAQLKDELADVEKGLEAWARSEHTDTLGSFHKLVMDGSSIELRASPGAVETLPGSTEKSALAAILASDDDALIEECVTVKTSLNKDGVKARAERSAYGAGQLEGLGLRVAKPRLFSFRPASVEVSAETEAEK